MPFVIYMSQDPVLSMEPGMLVCPKYGKRRLSVLNCLLLIVKLLLSIKNSWIESELIIKIIICYVNSSRHPHLHSVGGPKSL